MRWLSFAVGGVVAVLALGVLFVVSEASWGRLVAIVVVLFPVTVMPAILGLIPLPDEEAWAPSAGTRRWSRGVVATAVFMLIMFGATARTSVSDALSQLPGRHPKLGPLASAAARVGHALGPHR